MGEVPPHGSIRFHGNEIAGLPNHKSLVWAWATCPRIGIFSDPDGAPESGAGGQEPAQAEQWRAEQMLDMFPNLAQRADAPAGVLSGGEKQMLTISRP